MSSQPQILIGLVREGNTDERLLTSIIMRTFKELAYYCKGEVDIMDVECIDVKKSSFADMVVQASRKGVEKYGINILCIQTDADAATDEDMWKSKIEPAIKRLQKEDGIICKVTVPIVPVQMSEAWMLADKDLLKRQIMTDKSNTDLGIEKHPEQYSDPKATIEEAIKIVCQEKTKRKRRSLNISSLYQPIGQFVELEKLRQLSSYRKFEDNVRLAYKELNYMN